MSAAVRRIASAVLPWKLALRWFGGLLLASAAAYAFHFTAFQKQFPFSSLIAGFFMVVSIVLLWGALQRTLEYRKFGALELVLTGDPAPGGLLDARVDLRARDVPSVRVSIVACGTQVQSATGQPLERARSTQDVPVRAGVAEIRMRVPPSGANGNFWRLEIHAELPGVDLNRSFSLPMGASAPPSEPASAPEALAKSSLLVAAPLLVAANLVPIAGVLFWGWRVSDIVMLYWLENLVVGAFNVLRIIHAGSPALPRLANVPLALFFAAHYGFFCFMHGIFLVATFAEASAGRSAVIEDVLLEMLHDPGVLLAVLALAASHGYSFVRNYLGREEYRNVETAKVMFLPYGRVMLVHVFVLAGGFLLQALESPVAALVLFVAMKTVVDLAMHLRERKVLAAR